MGHMFIVNVSRAAATRRAVQGMEKAHSQAPYLFSTVWSLVKPWLDEATVRKIHILGKGYKTELQQYIDPANLPAELGGTCKCVGGCSLSDAGPWNKVAQA